MFGQFHCLFSGEHFLKNWSLEFFEGQFCLHLCLKFWFSRALLIISLYILPDWMHILSVIALWKNLRGIRNPALGYYDVYIRGKIRGCVHTEVVVFFINLLHSIPLECTFPRTYFAIGLSLNYIYLVVYLHALIFAP